jgi:hypothetical protein
MRPKWWDILCPPRLCLFAGMIGSCLSFSWTDKRTGAAMVELRNCEATVDFATKRVSESSKKHTTFFTSWFMHKMRTHRTLSIVERTNSGQSKWPIALACLAFLLAGHEYPLRHYPLSRHHRARSTRKNFARPIGRLANPTR